MTRSLALAATAAGVLVATAAMSSPAAQPAPRSEQRSRLPNVVLIMADDMRYDDLTHMPKVQRLLVDKGMSFTRLYSQNPKCCPARATILRGQYSHTTGVLHNDQGEPNGGFSALDDLQTLAVWLDRSYATGLVGKYLNGYRRASYIPPGWDTWNATVEGGTYDYLHLLMSSAGVVEGFPGQYATTVVGRRSARMLATTRGPFFLFSSFVAPHKGTPREPDDAWPTPYVARKYRDTYAGPPHPLDPSFNEPDISDKRPSVRSNPLLTKRQIARLAEINAQRRESLRSVDDQVGRLVSALRDRGVLKRTHVIFMSDNGYLLGEHRIFKGKGLPYAPASHVPFVIRGPGISAGTTNDTLASTADIAPTILGLTGQLAQVPAGYRFDGVDLLDPPVSSINRPIVLEAYTHPGGWIFRGIITADGWKYNVFPNAETAVDEIEMYDLETDPYEEQNLSDDPRFNKKEAQLEELYRQYRDCSGAECR